MIDRLRLSRVHGCTCQW